MGRDRAGPGAVTSIKGSEALTDNKNFMLAILLSAIGLSAVLGYLDYVLIPAMVLFLGIVIYAAYRRQRSA